jgi:hypothetical protein
MQHTTSFGKVGNRARHIQTKIKNRVGNKVGQSTCINTHMKIYFPSFGKVGNRARQDTHLNRG